MHNTLMPSTSYVDLLFFFKIGTSPCVIISATFTSCHPVFVI